jgi:ribosomal-protein-alanine N-acetyltransferase
MPLPDRPDLRTSRLILRPLREADAPVLFEIFSDAKVMRYWSTSPWTAIDQAQASIAGDLETMAADNHLRLGIELAADGALVGTCTLFGVNRTSRRAELGYALRSSAWGRGYMDEALRALLDCGFTELDLNRVEADIDPRNTASARTLERLGFVREGHLRERWIVAGEVSDSALYGLLRRDWMATK